MQVIEFKTKIINNIINIPEKFKQKLSSEDRRVRVILLLDESEDDHIFQTFAQEQFLNGYSDSDAIYDNY